MTDETTLKYVNELQAYMVRVLELEAALKRIADFGQANPGHGRSYAVIALRALVGDERD